MSTGAGGGTTGREMGNYSEAEQVAPARARSWCTAKGSHPYKAARVRPTLRSHGGGPARSARTHQMLTKCLRELLQRTATNSSYCLAPFRIARVVSARAASALRAVHIPESMLLALRTLYRLATDRSYVAQPTLLSNEILVHLPQWFAVLLSPFFVLDGGLSFQRWAASEIRWAVRAPAFYFLIACILIDLLHSTQPSMRLAWDQLPFILGLASYGKPDLSFKTRHIVFMVFDHGVPMMGFWVSSHRLLPGSGSKACAQLAIMAIGAAIAWAAVWIRRACSRCLSSRRKAREKAKRLAKEKERREAAEVTRRLEKETAQAEARERAGQRAAQERRARDEKSRREATAKQRQQQQQRQQRLTKEAAEARAAEANAAEAKALQLKAAKARAANEAASTTSAPAGTAEVMADASADVAIPMAAEAAATAQSASVAPPTEHPVESNAVADATDPVSSAIPSKSSGDNHRSDRDGCAEECVICMEAAPTHAAVPCGHRCLCAQCSATLQPCCPICRCEATMFMRVY